METSEILRCMINNLEEDDESFSKIITVLARGAFNMKGQEYVRFKGENTMEFAEEHWD